MKKQQRNFLLLLRFSTVLSNFRVSKLGQYADSAALSFYLYGKSLLGLAIQNNSVLGEKAEKAEEALNTVEDISADECEEEEETALEDICIPPADDLELAWENLDVARLILSKKEDSDSLIQLADVHICLGDISLENGTLFADCRKLRPSNY